MNLVHTVFEPHSKGPHPTILALHGPLLCGSGQAWRQNFVEVVLLNILSVRI